MIYIARYVYKKSIKMLCLYYHELIKKIEEHEKKEYSMIDDFMLIKVLEKIKKMKVMDINDNTKILIGTDGKLPDGISFKKIVILMASVIKDDKSLYPQLFLEEALYDE